ncbi:hypothetical protein JCM11641_002389 [Rhodosporidiobolus odoratus]
MSGWDTSVDSPDSAGQSGQALANLARQGWPPPPIFTLGQVQFTLPSQLYSLTCTSNVLVLACSGTPFPSSSASASAPPLPPQLIRIDLDRPTEVETIDLPWPAPSASSASSASSPPRTLHAVHVSPSCLHCLVSTTSGENYYLFLGSLASLPHPSTSAFPSHPRRPKPLPRLKGALIDSVAWSPSPPSSSNPYGTRDLLLGTSSGQILETSLLDPTLASSAEPSGFSLPVSVSGPGRSGGVERYVKQLFTLPVREGLVGLKYEVWNAGQGSGPRGKRVAVVAATKTRVYQFVGTAAGGERRKGEEAEGAWLEEVMRPYRDGEVRPKTLELPGEPQKSELHFSASSAKRDERGIGLSGTLAWMTEPGIYHGHLAFPSSSSSDLIPGEGIIDSASLIPYPSFPSSLSDNDDEDGASSASNMPVSMALTEFHFVLLFRDRVVAVDQLTDRVVYSELLNLPTTSPPLALLTDPIRRTLWIHSRDRIYELVVNDEGRDVWKVWVKRGEWAKAKSAAKTPSHRSQILALEADAHFTSQRYIPAAQAYAQTESRSFEEVVLRFYEKGERDALRYYLVARLERLNKTDLTQRLMLSTWLVEMYLAKLTELEDLAAAERSSEDAENLKVEMGIVEEDMRGLLGTYKGNLDPRTTFDLLTSHGRDDLTLYYASLVGDYGRVVQHHVQQQEWRDGLTALSKQEDLDLYYRFASVLLRHAPKETVDVFLRQPRLSARRLIPALTAPRPPSPSSSTSPPSPDPIAEHAIRYLNQSILVQHNSDPAVHNALLTLYATSPSTPALDAAFAHFVSAAPSNPSTSLPYYDLNYALRLCRSNKRTKACVVVYSKLGLFEESVELALEVDDLELAKECAEMPPVEDELLRKKLWLKVAKHVVGKKNDIKTAMRFLESTPLLKIEDILPFFPDFVVIDDFKDEICTALEGYAAHIERLKGDMADATKAAEAIKSDIAELDQRFVVVDANEKCGSCRGQLLTRQFYVFPCQHCFHADCLIQQVTKTLSPTQLRRMLSLQAQLAPTAVSSSTASSSARQARQRTLLDDAALGGAQLKLAAQASVQAVDQLRKLVLPDALLSAIGGAIPLPNSGGGRVRGANGRSAGAGTGAGGGGAMDAATLAQSASARREAKEKLELREQLDELLARECVLCEGAIGSIERGFVEEGEEM